MVTLDVVAPIGLAFDAERCRLADGKVQIAVVAETPSSLDGYVSVTYATGGPAGRHSGVHCPTQKEWSRGTASTSFEYAADVGDEREATVYLRLNEKTMAQASLTDSTQRESRLEAARAVFIAEHPLEGTNNFGIRR